MRLPAQLHTRVGCHLCEAAEADLRRLAGKLNGELGVELELELIDIDLAGNQALAERYGERVPVLALGGREYAAPLSPELLERALRNAFGCAAAAP